MRLPGLLLFTVACGAAAPRQELPSSAARTSVASETTTSISAPSTPQGKLRLPEARRFMLALINRDRASEHLPPVELDEGPPTLAGQRHAEDMARYGFLGHWGTDGSVPEQRYTEAGGEDINFENAACVIDEKRRELEREPLIDPKAIEAYEAQFFNETPPNDGHRKNILRPAHKKVGIGLALAQPLPNELIVPCVAQEFTYDYGTYGKLPKSAKIGERVRVEGTVAPGVSFGGVGVARIELPKPVPIKELNTRWHYVQADPFQMYFPRGYKTPIPVDFDGSKFSIELPLSDHDKPGLYEITVWAKVPGQTERGLVSISQRTILVR